MKNGIEIGQSEPVQVKTAEQLAQGIVSLGEQLLEGQSEVSRELEGLSFKILASDSPETKLTIQIDSSNTIKRPFRFSPTWELEETFVGHFLFHDTYEFLQDGVRKTTIRDGWTGDDYLTEEFKSVPPAEDLQNLLSGLQSSQVLTSSK